MQNNTNRKPSKPWYKRFWVWVLIVIALLVVIGSFAPDEAPSESNSKTETTTQKEDGSFDPDAMYAATQVGMNKDQVKLVAGVYPEDCTLSETPGVGSTEVCTYGNALRDDAVVVVTFMDGAVYSKTRVEF